MPLFDVVLDVSFSCSQIISYTVEAEDEFEAEEKARELLSPTDVDSTQIYFDEVDVFNITPLESIEE